MSKLDGHEYTYRRAMSEISSAPLHHAYGIPAMANLASHQMSSKPAYPRTDEDDYTTYQILHPVACDPVPQVGQFSSVPYPEYFMAQSSHYQHIQYGTWPPQDAFHYGMQSGEICRPVSSLSSEGADVYSSEGYSTKQGYNGNQQHTLLLSPHAKHKMGDISAHTSKVFQMLQPVQVVRDVNLRRPVVLLDPCSPDRIPHSMMMDLNTESVPTASAQCYSAEDLLLNEQELDVGYAEMTVSNRPHQIQYTSAGLTVSLSPRPYVSQTVKHEEVVQTKGNGCVKLEKSKRPCNCTKTMCLKLYCECFANGELCNNCKCTNCFNNAEHDFKRSQAIKACLDRNPGAFQPKIGCRNLGSVKECHTKGCNCKRSGCLKNYCECYEAKIMCTSSCKCVDCKNYDEGYDENETSVQDRPDYIYYPTRCPVSVITRDVVEATCGCLLAQAEDAQKNNYNAAHAERMILEEFGQCLTQIVRSIFKSRRV